MRITPGFFTVALLCLLIASIEGSPRRNQADATNYYCADGDPFSSNCRSGWNTPPPQKPRPEMTYNQCKWYDGVGCQTGWREG